MHREPQLPKNCDRDKSIKGHKEEKRWSLRKKQESCWFSLRVISGEGTEARGDQDSSKQPGTVTLSPAPAQSATASRSQVLAGGGGERRCIHHASPPPDPKGWRVPTFREHLLLMSATSEGLADGSPARWGGSQLERAALGSEPSALGSTPFPILTFTRRRGN